ncbi:unnamed protein product [Chondrus crispus]|uniref:PHD-type domain-containing protein n=1 Tax=Chondrus crispus TaxID=2769 RepID=R7Q9V1_CHOCR|nr:unnamed protein product [Chondrus crispus]CDF35312.1 unnamed protein product [Chondrus crispus]|eukprot:XP_005715131.1 unnamed protein product [Chondrus crispus]
MPRKRTASALSLESLVGDDEFEAAKRPKAAGDTIGRRACPRCGGVDRCRCASTASTAVARTVPEVAKRNTHDDNVVTVQGSAATAKKGAFKTLLPLVNIAECVESDDAARDRFIFFSYRPQRFHFPQSTYLSALSPFAAVASAMTGVSSKGVCAVCGGGGTLCECSRCPLAFHRTCIDPSRMRFGSPWFCNSCRSVKGKDRTERWNPAVEPPALPAPASGFRRLIADASEGNPIDFVMHPTLHGFYRKERGGDWSQCHTCNEITIADPGVLTESVHEPFECRYAFWSGETPKLCRRSGDERRKSKAILHLESCNRKRSRRRNALFFYGFGEEDREDFGFPPLREVAAEPDVIVIEDDSEAILASPSPHMKAPTSGKGHRSIDDMLQNQGEAPGQGGLNGSVVKGPFPPLPDQPLASASKTAEQRTLLALIAGAPETQASQGQQSLTMPTSLRTNGREEATVDASLGRSKNGSVGLNAREATRPSETKADRPVSRCEDSPYGRHGSVHGDHLRVAPDPEGNTQGKATAAVSQRPGGDHQGLHDAALTTVNQGGGQVQTSEPMPAKNVHSNLGSSINGDRFLPNDAAGLSSTKDAIVKPESDLVHQSDRASDRIQERVLECIASIDFDQETEDCLTDIALENDKELFQLYIGMYKLGNAKFKRQATRLARRRIAKRDAALGAPAPLLPQHPPYGSGYSGTLAQHLTGSTQGLLKAEQLQQMQSLVSSAHVSRARSSSEGLKQMLERHQDEEHQLCVVLRKELEQASPHEMEDLRFRQREKLNTLRRRHQAELGQVPHTHGGLGVSK